MEKLAHVLVSALLGTVLGWSANALQLGGRVTAMEATLIRIEARLDRLPGTNHEQKTTATTWQERPLQAPQVR